MQGKSIISGAAALWIAAILVFTVCALQGCSSHRRVVRGDQATEVHSPGAPGKRHTHTDKPSTSTYEISREADNEYARRLMQEAYRWIGTPYLYGGESLKGTDCSGFVMMAFKNALDISLPRTSRDMGNHCEIIPMKGDKIDCSKLKVGDLIFFHTGSDKTRINHVGIYAGDGRMIHAGSSKGVCLVDLSGKYYNDHFHQCGRVPAYHRLIKRK